MDLNFTGERQVSKTLEGIEKKHLDRYCFAKNKVRELLSKDNIKISDIGCGIGYGSSILSELNCSIDSYDISKEAIDFANKYYKKDNINYFTKDCSDSDFLTKHYDVIVSFEFLEHINIDKSKKILHRIIEKSDLSIISIPINKPSPFHKIVLKKEEVKQYYDEALKSFSNKHIIEEWIQDTIFYIVVIGLK